MRGGKSSVQMILVAALLGELIRRLSVNIFFRGLTKILRFPGPPRPGCIRRLPPGLPCIGDVRVPGGSPGVELSTVCYVREEKAPTLIIRTPYSKKALEIVSLCTAKQGFNVLVQDCRGRFASSGEQTFGAFEDIDGAATIEWLATSGFEWFDPKRVVMFGISYLGIVQWALIKGLQSKRRKAERLAASAKERSVASSVASPRGPSRRNTASAAAAAAASATAAAAGVRMAAIAPSMASSRIFSAMFSNNQCQADFYIRYLHLMTQVNGDLSLLACVVTLALFDRKLPGVFKNCRSMQEMHKAIGIPMKFKYNPRPESRFWQFRDYSAAIVDAPPAFVSSGWYDMFVECSLKDYEDLVKAHGPGHHRLLIGPWHHWESFITRDAFVGIWQPSIEFLMRHTGLLPPPTADEKPVKLWVMGERRLKGEWREFDTWPPQSKEQPLLLGPSSLRATDDGDLQLGGSQVEPSCMVYDPLDPTPTVRGLMFHASEAGECEQHVLEQRQDVLKFDSSPLTSDALVVGRARIRLSVRTSLPHFDLFVRICDVHKTGKSYNVCDGWMRRAKPPDRAQSHAEMQSMRRPPSEGALTNSMQLLPGTVELTLSGTAKRFKKGHRIRLMVMMGSYPMLARNFGDAGQEVSDDPLETSPCTMEIVHDGQAPSVLWLPLVTEEDAECPSPRRRSLSDAAARRDSGSRAFPRPFGKQSLEGMRRVQSNAQ